MKFKIGDKVRVIKVNAPHSQLLSNLVGNVFTIKNVFKEREYPYQLREYDACNWCDDELELAEFTKVDLKDGMVVEYQDGYKGLVIADKIIGFDGYININHFSDTLEAKMICNNINKIYKSKGTTLNNYFHDRNLTLIWERPKEEKPIEMTVAEIEKELGYKVKIINKEE